VIKKPNPNSLIVFLKHLKITEMIDKLFTKNSARVPSLKTSFTSVLPKVKSPMMLVKNHGLNLLLGAALDFKGFLICRARCST